MGFNLLLIQDVGGRSGRLAAFDVRRQLVITAR
jgi:hypothetical protein